MDQKQVIVENFDLLLRCLDPSIYLLGKLRNVDFLENRLRRIQQLPTVDEKNDAFLRSLLEIPAELQESVMTKFIAALRSCAQSHVANIFRQESDEIPMSTEHWDLLRTNITELSKFLDPENGLLLRLFSKGIITLFDSDRVRSAAGYNERAQMLVEIIMRKSDDAFQGFVDALNDTGQTHVAYILTKQGDDRPLCEEFRKKLTEHRAYLVNYMDSKHSGLITALVSKRVFSEYDLQRVTGRQPDTDSDRSEVIVDLMARKTQSSFDSFVAALEETGQKHVAVELIGEEVVARIIARTRSGACLPDAEKAIRQHIEDAVECNATEVQILNRVLHANEIAITEISEGSIIIKFRCENKTSLENLKELHISHRLDELLTEAFCPRFTQEDLESLHVDIHVAEFERCERTFREMKLMTSEHRDALESSAEQLADKLTVTGDLLDNLSLCRRRRQAIEQSATREQQMKTLLDIVSRQPDSAFTQLLGALTDTQQHHARHIITSFCNQNTTSLTDATASTTQMAARLWQMIQLSNEKVNEIVTCPICLEELKDPRSLPCLHSFCFKCLQVHYKDKYPGDDVSCPVCRKVFQIPQGGLNSLPLNFFFQNLIEAKDLKSKETRILCDEHRDKRLEFHCNDCRKNICMMCFEVSHQQHKCSEVDKISNDFAKQIQSNIEQFSSRIFQFREAVRKVDVANKKFLQTIEEMKHKVRQRGNEIKNLVDDHVTKLTEELNDVKEHSVKEAEPRVQSINLAIAALESFQAYALDIVSRGSPCDITRSFNEVHTKAEELLKSHVIADDYSPPVVLFVPTDKLVKGGQHNIVGGLVVLHLLYTVLNKKLS